MENNNNNNKNKLFHLLNDFYGPKEIIKNPVNIDDSKQEDKERIDEIIKVINTNFEYYKNFSYYDSVRQNNFIAKRDELISDPNIYIEFEPIIKTKNANTTTTQIEKSTDSNEDDTNQTKPIKKIIKKCCKPSTSSNLNRDEDNLISYFKRNMRRLENSLEDIIVSMHEKIDKKMINNNTTLNSIDEETTMIIETIKNKIIKKEEILEKEKSSVERIYKNKIVIEAKVNCIADLLDIINTNTYDPETQYNINLEALHNIKEPLTDLNNLIGMKQLKENIVDQILYFIQNLHLDVSNKKANDFLHTVIYGPPGTGKTEVAKIMGQIYCKLGILKKGNFRKVTRADLVAGYLGQTAIKTADVIKDALDGVLFIDEAYSLGNQEKRDSFAKECIDTLCEGLSDHKDRLMVIIAGYESELRDCFFSYNQGLESRFSWRFKIDDYKGEELYKIFLKKLEEFGWKIHDTDIETTKYLTPEWFNKNLVYFKYFGRDVETLLSKVKICHSRRVFGLVDDEKRKVTFKDLEKGFELFCSSEEVKKRKDNEDMKYRLSSLYI